MKKILVWPVAIITGLVSLVAMCVFDFILSLIYYFIGKVAFLSEIIDFIGEVLDLGLTVLVASLIATAIWKFGHSVIKKISDKDIEFQNSPVSFINNLFFFVFLAMIIFLGFQFAALIGEVVSAYTAGFEGLGKFLMFFEAIKDTFSVVCGENIVFYKIGSNALILFIINIFAYKFID